MNKPAAEPPAEIELGAEVALTAEGISAGYGGPLVLHGIDLALTRGRITTLIGPNGCGKSTLLRVLARQLDPVSGRVLIDTEPSARLAPREFARRLSFLPQAPPPPDGMTVAELVGYGRHPHHHAWRRASAADREAVTEALSATGLTELAETLVSELSGGQRQRAWIALAVAQASPIVLLDEPTTFLDPAHQLEVLELVRHLNSDRGRTVVMVLHDLALAGRISDEIVAMAQGRILAHGPTAEVLTPTGMREVFGVDCLTVTDPEGGSVLVPWRRG